MLVLLLIFATSPIHIESRMLLIGSGSRPVNAPGCYVTALNYMLAFNETYYPIDNKSCEKYTCDYDGYTYITRCVESFEGHCLKVKGNKSLSYPECCDFYNCSRSANKFPTTIVQDLNSDDTLKQNKSTKNKEVSGGQNIETFSTILTENKNMPYVENAIEALAKNSSKNISEIVEEGATYNVTEKSTMSDSNIFVQDKNMSSIDIEKEGSSKTTSSKLNADFVITKEDSTTNTIQNNNTTDSENSTVDSSENEKTTERIQNDKTTGNSGSDLKQPDAGLSVSLEDVSKTELLNVNSNTENTNSLKSKANDQQPSSVTVVERNGTETINSSENSMSVDTRYKESNKDKKSSGNDTKSEAQEKET